jgi:hypothetical protein
MRAALLLSPMLNEIRREIEAYILAHQEAEDWSGELDHTAHIHSYEGVHNWRRNDSPRVELLYGFLDRELERLRLDVMHLAEAPSQAVDEFGDAPSVASLARAIALLRENSSGNASVGHYMANSQFRNDDVGEPTSVPPSWEELKASLEGCLRDLGDEEFLVLSYKKVNYYVQFAGSTSNGMRAEAASNAFIQPQAARLGAAQEKLMASLGWHHPTGSTSDSGGDDVDGSPNFFLDTPHPVDFAELAQLAIQTLRQVFSIPSPRDLQYEAFHNEGADIRFPTLRIARVRK